MLTFCPTCANMLLVDHSPHGGGLKLYCQTCPYMYDITKTMRTEVRCETKEVDDVLGGEDAWKNVDKTSATCPKCNHGQAYFMQIQIRSGTSPCPRSTSAVSVRSSGGRMKTGILSHGVVGGWRARGDGTPGVQRGGNPSPRARE